MGQTSEPAAAIIGECPGHSLAALPVGTRGVLTRVSDSDPDMLRYLADRGISVGDRVEVLDVQPFDGPIRARIGNAIHVLGSRLAQAMRVEIGV